ncbi:MAG: histidine--tRNA ligase [Planctomycetota bacterium]|jgi:histidyl-tRNA synthetase
MAKKIKAPRGTFDILPDEAALWVRLESAARDAFRRYGYGEIRTPIIEETRLFVRGIGDMTDIVEKEMYTFEGRGRDESISLRPEATAGVVRAYIEHNLPKSAPFQKLAYIGPMFRYERPQAGRQRQFNQIGVEVLGTYAPEADVETIALALDIFAKFGLAGVRLKINSIGCRDCRPDYRDAVRSYIGDRVDQLCSDCKRRYERNIFRVLDCKETTCRALIDGIPEIEGYLCDDCGAHFSRVKELLAALGIDFTKEKFLVRGFDYYTRTVYEIAHSALGARDAVCGGGRYDNLVEDLGGPPMGAVGFSIGCEPTLLALSSSGAAAETEPDRFAAVIVMVDETIKAEAFKILAALRRSGIEADMPFDVRSVKAQMRGANRRNARVAVILGPDEIAAGSAKVKDMATGAERTVPLDTLANAVREIVESPTP